MAQKSILWLLNKTLWWLVTSRLMNCSKIKFQNRRKFFWKNENGDYVANELEKLTVRCASLLINSSRIVPFLNWRNPFLLNVVIILASLIFHLISFYVSRQPLYHTCISLILSKNSILLSNSTFGPRSKLFNFGMSIAKISLAHHKQKIFESKWWKNFLCHF